MKKLIDGGNLVHDGSGTGIVATLAEHKLFTTEATSRVKVELLLLKNVHVGSLKAGGKSNSLFFAVFFAFSRLSLVGSGD